MNPAACGSRLGNPQRHFLPGWTSLCARKASSIHSKRASVRATSRHASSRADIAIGRCGPVALNVPDDRSAARAAIHRARSRTSMNCTVRDGRPGAATAPPSATRCGHHVNRSVASQGPTMRPGRTTIARSAKTSRATDFASGLERAVLVGRHRCRGADRAPAAAATPRRSRHPRRRRSRRRRGSASGESRSAAADLRTDLGQVARCVDHRIPGTCSRRLAKRLVVVAIAGDALHARVEGRDLPAIEVDDLEPGSERRIGEGAAQEDGAAEDEDPSSPQW